MSYHNDDSGYYAECPEENSLIFQAAPGPTGPPTSIVNVEKIARFQSGSIQMECSKKNGVAIIDLDVPFKIIDACGRIDFLVPITVTGDPTIPAVIAWDDVKENEGFVVNTTSITPNSTAIYRVATGIGLEVFDDKENTFTVTVNILPTSITKTQKLNTNAIDRPRASFAVFPIEIRKIEADTNLITTFTVTSDNPVGTATATLVYASTIILNVAPVYL